MIAVIRDHQHKSYRIRDALRAEGWLVLPLGAPADVLLVDHDVDRPGYSDVIEAYVDHGTRVVMYPHGAPVVMDWDGIVEPYPVDVNLVISTGQREVMRAYGYPHPLHIMGWPYCEQRRFQATGFESVLFAPQHPLGNGYLDATLMEANRRAYETVLSWGIPTTVRHIGSLEANGLWEAPDVLYESGRMNNSLGSIDSHDLVVARETFLTLAVARGVPAVTFFQSVVPSRETPDEEGGMPAHWDEYREMIRYPYDLEDSGSSVRACMREASEWRERFIGEPMNPHALSEVLEAVVRYPRRQRRPHRRWPAPQSWPGEPPTFEIPDKTKRFITQLPSATTYWERMLAYNTAAKLWDGQGDVFENGPLLGGSTRALALGMLANAGRVDAARLRTFDWFSFKCPLDVTEDTWQSLIRTGYLSADEYAKARQDGSFLPLFKALHDDHDYSDLVVPSVGYLPGSPTDDTEELFTAPNQDFTLVFVDGCKSWYGTKHWITELAPHLPVGSYLLFQDFGQYTCFWIPCLIGALGDSLKFVSRTDYTALLRVAQPIDSTLFPMEATDCDRDDYDDLFEPLIDAAILRDDDYGIMALWTQRAAALAYIGLLDEAVAEIDELLATDKYQKMRYYLEEARRAPTYRPSPSDELVLLPQ